MGIGISTRTSQLAQTVNSSLRSQVRFGKFPRNRLASGCVLAACAGISLALHVGMLASIPANRGASVATQSALPGMIFKVEILSVTTSAVAAAVWTPPDRLAPITSSLPRMRTMPTAAWTPPRFDDSEYFRGSQLTVRPKPAEYIAIPFPSDVPREGTWQTSLAIFIDEDGTVARIEIVGSRLPKPFEDGAIAAFGRARYLPGRIGDAPVKSRMLVTVDFANEAGDAPQQPRIVAIPGKR
jgi:hypothetical protein